MLTREFWSGPNDANFLLGAGTNPSIGCHPLDTSKNDALEFSDKKNDLEALNFSAALQVNVGYHMPSKHLILPSFQKIEKYSPQYLNSNY